MPLKEYEVDGRTYLFEDADVPEGATAVEAPAKPAKAATAPKNKAATAEDTK